jgi:catechol 2,3-dioxygenase-like lactoylglutathione lyase family enzyme
MRRLLLGLALVAPFTLHAQTVAPAPPSSDTSTATTAFGRVHGAFWALSVADVAASTRWYSEIFGLRVLFSVPRANGAAVSVLGGGGLIVELVQLDSAVALPREPQRAHGYFKSGLMVDDLTRTLATLRARGAQVFMGPFPARDGQRANVIIRDNAGNLIQLFEY